MSANDLQQNLQVEVFVLTPEQHDGLRASEGADAPAAADMMAASRGTRIGGVWDPNNSMGGCRRDPPAQTVAQASYTEDACARRCARRGSAT